MVKKRNISSYVMATIFGYKYESDFSAELNTGTYSIILKDYPWIILPVARSRGARSTETVSADILTLTVLKQLHQLYLHSQ